MDCLSTEQLRDLVDGELGGSAAAQAAEHIRSCERCRREFTEILTLYEGLSAVVAQDPCPSRTMLRQYAARRLAAGEIPALKNHIDFCGKCRSHVWLLAASEPELTQWRADEERADQEYQATELDRDVARETLASVLPIGLEFLDRLWDAAHQLVADLRARASEQWPQFGTPAELTGALGFGDTSDPEGAATSVILVTTLLVGRQIADGEIVTSHEPVATAVREAAHRFGAGKELQKRLVETIPPILLRFYGPSDEHPAVS